MRWCRPGRASKSSGLHRLSRGFSSARRPVSDGTSLSLASVILWTTSVEPVPLSGTLHIFPYCWVFYDGGSGPPRGQQSSNFSLVPTSGVYPHSVLVSLSVYLTGPPLAGTPRSGASDGSPLVCLHRDPHWEQQSFSSALTRLLAMTGSLPHRSHPHQTTPCTLHATTNLQPICLLSAGAAHLTLVVWGGRLTSYLYSAHKSVLKFSTPEARLRHRESHPTLSLASGLDSDLAVFDCMFWLTNSDLLTSTCCLRVLYILDTCRLQVTKVTKGALNASQSEEARDSICLARPEHLHRGFSILNSFTGT